MATITRVPLEIERVDKKVSRGTISRRLTIENEAGEYTLKMVLVVEDFRAGFYILFVIISIIGLILTKTSATEDPHALLIQVYGVSNLCHVFDLPPSTYVLPVLWCLPMLSGIMYNITAIFRIWIAYLEMKLSHSATILLIMVHVYGVLSFMFFSIIFAVQPDPEHPATMVYHTIPYINLKVMLAALHCAVVYFGIKVSWVNMNFPRWFHLASIIHAIALAFLNLLANIILINALGNMGAHLEGKGLWWSVRNDMSKFVSDMTSTYLSNLLGVIFPLFQALYISRKGVKNHAVIVSVSDNRRSGSIMGEL